MSRPVKEFSSGKVKAAVFQGEYNGKATYSFKFQKSYLDPKTQQWVNSDYFYATDLRDLYILVTKLVVGQVKERTPEQVQESQPQQPQQIQESQPDSDPNLPF